MSALKQNPFLVGFGAAMVVGIGALGYLTYSAAEAHSAARAEYENAATDLNRLQNLRPFPNTENLAKVAEQKKELQEKVTKLQRELAASKIKVEDISPTGFQDKLRDTVARVSARAAESNVALPLDDKQKFYLGFGTYQGEPPKGPAAPLLYRELRAIESLMNLILDVKNVAIKEFTRQPLAEEQGPKVAAPEPKKGAGAKKGPADDDSKKVVQKDSFTLKFSTTPENFQRILSGIVNNKEQFLIPRHITILNEKPEAQSKVVAAPPAPAAPVDPAAAAAAAAAGAVPAAPAAPTLEYVFGKELVEVTMALELVDVAEPEAPAAEKAGKTVNRK
jgi:hypothetical protein